MKLKLKFACLGAVGHWTLLIQHYWFKSVFTFVKELAYHYMVNYHWIIESMCVKWAWVNGSLVLLHDMLFHRVLSQWCLSNLITLRAYVCPAWRPLPMSVTSNVRYACVCHMRCPLLYMQKHCIFKLLDQGLTQWRQIWLLCVFLIFLCCVT